MDSLTYYLGKETYQSNVDRGRMAKAVHFLVAAVIAANEEKLTMEQLIQLLNEANDFVPKKKDKEQTLRELGQRW